MSGKSERKQRLPVQAVDEGEVRPLDAITGSLPDVEVLAQPTRRTFSAAYKQRILKEAEACQRPGEIGALLRREGLYSSHLTAWRQALDRGARAGLAPQKRGVKAKQRSVSAREYERVCRKNEKLERELSNARTIIDVQKKLSEMIGVDLPSPEDDG